MKALGQPQRKAPATGSTATGVAWMREMRIQGLVLRVRGARESGGRGSQGVVGVRNSGLATIESGAPYTSART